MAHKRKVAKPQLVVASTVASSSHTTLDNRRVRTRYQVVEQNATISTEARHQFWAEDLATNAAREADTESFSYQLGDDSLMALPERVTQDGITVVIAKRYANSDRPLQSWYPLCDEYLEENLRREGRGSPKNYARCGGSRCMDTNRDCPNRECDGAAEWRCADQACFGETMFCARCITAAHAHHPTHFVEKWNGTHFVRKRTWLQELGLRVQLGHPPGVVCPFRQSAAHDFVLYDITGVHELSVDFCGCPTGPDNAGRPLERRVQLMRACWWPATITAPNTCATFRVLRLFQIINCLGKLSAYDFLRGLEMCTNHDGLDKPPDRRKPFMYIMRQWREVKRHKRAKRGHSAGGVRGTSQGELVVHCRACPQPGWNLPDGWEDAPPFYRFIYILFLAQDANFRLSNRNVSTEVADPILGDGWGYFCKRYGEDGYYAHIAKHVNEEQLSNCSGFHAILGANSKRIKGLRSSGIAGVTCARHNMWRANGIGDLQAGERQSNMDFLLLSVLMTFQLLWLVVSYDVACQYMIHFWERMAEFPEHMQLKLAPSNVWWKVPNFHLPDHKKKCHSAFSFHWMRGAGKTHAETIEQNWSFSNGAARSTRLMGPGSRQATLEDIFGFHNYERLLAMHRVFPKRLATAIKDGSVHREAFESFTSGLAKERPEQVKEWRAWVERWEAKQQTTGEDSPFELQDEVTTLRAIQLQIATEEFICTVDGVEVERDHSPGSFISMGLVIEETQRRLTVDVKSCKDPSPTQKLGFLKRRASLRKDIQKFRKIQRVYMPSVRGLLSEVQQRMYDGHSDVLSEATRLFMPSEIANAEDRANVCAINLPEIEARMREGEASEALESVRAGLRTRTMTNRYKLRNYTGQGQMTRGQDILRQINEERLRVLGDDDVRALTAEEKHINEHWAEVGGAIIEGGVARAGVVATGEGSHTLSWIWYTTGVVEGENDVRLEEALRVEWCKGMARMTRFDEEVRLLREEMRRTVAYGETAAATWEALDEALPEASPELLEGRRAYVAEQVATERARVADLRKRWQGILEKADLYLGGREVVAAGSAEVVVEVALGDELDPEDEEARLEAEEE
ncbi:hypothetical protein B0H14DRAFT_3490386 [Mycena olivaceomarginata]|nr:hypothetical protein B0H14DRAFT_3490386 [Mycena olivaceomarginata]